MRMNFALCTDDKYVMPAMTCITSLFENNKKHDCVVTLVTGGLTPGAKERFIELGRIYNQKVNVVNVDLEKFKDYPTGDYPISMYLRYLLPEILSSDSTVLYLDCDIIVRHDLTELFSTDLGGKAAGVVMDQECDDVTNYNRLGLNWDYQYFNSGVMLFNLDYWREHRIFPKLVDWIRNNPERCLYPDQDALNVVLEGKVKYLSPKFNCQTGFLDLNALSKLHHSKWESISDSVKKPEIVHFCSWQKPWYEGINPKYKDEFLKYASMNEITGFKGCPKYWQRPCVWDMIINKACDYLRKLKLNRK